jgi:hypothetical protein
VADRLDELVAPFMGAWLLGFIIAVVALVIRHCGAISDLLATEI